jgi:hypothetical protein
MPLNILIPPLNKRGLEEKEYQQMTPALALAQSLINFNL